MIPEDVHQVYGSIPARALWFHARRLDPTKGGKQTGESLAWSPPGESVQATSWPVEELTPTMLLDRWGPGRYRLQWVGAGASGGRRAMGQSQVVDVRPPDETAKRRRRASAEERALPLPAVDPSPHAARPTDDARDAYRIAAEMMRDQDARAHSRQAEIAAQAQAQVVQLVQLSAAMVPKADAGAALAPALDRLAAALETQGRTLEALAARVARIEADEPDDEDDGEDGAPPPQDLAATVAQVLPVLMMLGESLKAGSAPAVAAEKLPEKAAE